MVAQRPPRLSMTAREAIHRRISGMSRSAAIPVAQMLRHVRSEIPASDHTDEELVGLIIAAAMTDGRAVHFDKAPDPL